MSKLPKDWKIKELSEVATIQTGLAKGKNNLKNPVSLPYLRVANVQDGYFDLSEIKTIEASSAEVERYRLKPNDVLLTEGGDFDKLGRGHIWRGQIDPCLHQNHIFVVRPNPQILKPEFLTALTASHYGRTYFLSCSKQTTNLASVNSTQLKQFPVLLPPMREQEEITKIVGCWDRVIEQAEKLIAAKSRIKRGLMQQLLTGKRRYAEFDGQEWKTKELKNVGKIESGGTPDTSLPENWNGSINWCTPTDITSLQTRYLGPTVRKLSERGLKNSSAKLLPPNSVIVCTRATIGDCAINIVEMATNQGFKSIVPNENVETEFLYHSIVFSKKRLLRLAAGSTFGEVSKSDFERITISLPPLEEQRRIAAVLNACDQEITLLKQQLDALKRQKRGLMQKLLTGQIRVKV